MPRDTRVRFEREVNRWRLLITAAFQQAIRDIRDTVNLQRLVQAVEGGDAVSAVGVLKMDDHGVFDPLGEVIRDAYRGGGDYQVESLPKRNPATNELLVLRMQARNPRAEQWLRENAGRLIVGLQDDVRVVVRDTLVQAMERGQNPRSTALDLVGRVSPASRRRNGGLIGLTPTEAQYVRNMADDLSDPSTMRGYFDRKARDKRFDRTVAKAVREGKPLSASQIRQISGRYSDRLLKLRGERIARTEAVQALNAGRSEAVRQLIDSGQVSENAVKKKWRATFDARTRDSHAALHGTAVELDEPFVSPVSGARLMFPGDASQGAPAEEIIQCRCTYSHEIDFFAGLE